MSYEQRCQEDARLAILAELAQQRDATLNSRSITRVIEALGIKRSNEWIENQLRRLAEFDAIAVREVNLTGIGRVLVATLKRAGRDHVEQRALLAGVSNPADVE